MFSDYVERNLYGSVVSASDGPRKAPRVVGNTLTELNRALYYGLREQIVQVAAGTQSSTVFKIPLASLTLEKTSWSAEELGVDAIVENGALTAAAKEAIYDRVVNLKTIMNALTSDCPYEMYWFNKTPSGGAMLNYRPGLTSTGELTFEYFTLYFSVVPEYAGAEEYTVRTDVGGSVAAAKANADAIVQKYEDLSDYEKLAAYRDEICALASYNSLASKTEGIYGNPWQLIWVFDGDPSTTVVCEGYAKAFQYLCDRSRYDFDEETVCISVTGQIPGGLHMWNIVAMPDGNNYLVDLTNHDGGYDLFLKGASGSLESGYTVSGIRYTYDATTLALYPAAELTLAASDYDPKSAPEIETLSLSGAVVTVAAKSLTYTGAAQTPAVTVTLNGNVLAEDVHYTVSYENNTAVGTATVTVTGIRRYEGSSARGTFTIVPALLSGAVVSASAMTYTGGALTPAVTVKQGGKTLVSGADYTVAYGSNVNAGTATITVTGKGNYTGTASGTFKINAASLSGASVTAAAQTYTGGARTPAVTVKLNGKTLVSGTDYTAAYKNNTNAGAATVTVTGKGNYTGAASGTFTINAASIAGAAVTVAKQYYNGVAVTPAPTVKVNGVTLRSGTDYTVTYKNNTKAGTASLTVTGKGNYTGTVTKSFTISALATPKVSAVANDAGGVKVSWKAVDGAVKYRVFRKTSGGSWKKVGDTTGTSMVDAKAKNGTTYYYTVRCVSSNGKVYTSKYNTTGKSITYLAAPTVKSAANATAGITVKWSKVSGATGYVLYRRAEGAGKWSKVATVSSGSTVSYTDTKVKAKSGTTYYYTVRAVKGKVTSGYDPTGMGLLRLASPTLSSAKASAKGITVKWKKVSGAAGYYVYRKTAGGKWKKVATIKGGATVSYVDAKGKKGTTYYYTVRAYSGKTLSGYNATGKYAKAK